MASRLPSPTPRDNPSPAIIDGVESTDLPASRKPPGPPPLPGDCDQRVLGPPASQEEPVFWTLPSEDDDAVAQTVHEFRRWQFSLSGCLRLMVAWLTSGVFHMVLLVVLGLWVLERRVETNVNSLLLTPDDMTVPEEDLFPEELDEQIDPAKDLIFAKVLTGENPGESAVAISLPEFTRRKTSNEPQEQVARPGLEAFALPAPARELQESITRMIGEQRAVVDGYQEALDRITQEVLLLLEKEKVLLVWCFDQSESMKDDQKEIRDRLTRVYEELGLAKSASGGSLTNAVTSYGQSFLVHTPAPTSNMTKLRKAIDSVPIDPSGKEIMLQAVSRSISEYQAVARRGRRRMALVLVTDESGDFEENYRFLEEVIIQAKKARCMVYVLGREAVFSYPYAYMRWKHPQTHHMHWLRIDRGPETPYVEQLQTNGFHRRYDAHPSGFGPYDQSRLARETGGIFFLLPSIETSLVRGEKRRYDLEQMRRYLPDVRSREQYLLARQNSELQKILWKVISDLNPYDAKIAQIIEMRVHFSPQPEPFLRQVQVELAKSLVYLEYLGRAIKAIEQAKPLREEERASRWQANYDLLYAQLLAYAARIYEYGAYLEHFKRNPQIVPLVKPPNLRLTGWHIRTRKKTLTGETIKPFVEKSMKLLKQIMVDHPSTPWSARARYELNRGFGVELAPHYHGPTPKITGPLVQVPRL